MSFKLVSFFTYIYYINALKDESKAISNETALR